jgi:peroxiredoxin
MRIPIMLYNVKCFVLLAMFMVVLAGRSDAATLTIGAAAPGFAGLAGTDGKSHSLADYKDAKLLVLVFTCNHCPVAKAYEDRLIALQRDYGAKGVQVVAVNVNNLPADRMPEMEKRAKQKGFNFPYLYDPSQKIGHRYGAAVTPHVFVLDNDRKVAYIGAIDDSMQAKEVKSRYLRNALDSLLEGKKPTVATTRQFGCGIQYQ